VTVQRSSGTWRYDLPEYAMMSWSRAASGLVFVSNLWSLHSGLAPTLAAGNRSAGRGSR
jgi:hypothetical protein